MKMNKKELSEELDRLSRELEELRRRSNGSSVVSALISPTKRKRGRPVGSGTRKRGAKSDQLIGCAVTKAEKDLVDEQVRSSNFTTRSAWIRHKLGL